MLSNDEIPDDMEEDFNIGDELDYGVEEIDADEGGHLQLSSTMATGFGGDYYDEIESYEEVVN